LVARQPTEEFTWVSAVGW